MKYFRQKLERKPKQNQNPHFVFSNFLPEIVLLMK